MEKANPTVLQGKLVFGDTNQITTLKMMRRHAEENKDRVRRIQNGELRKYEVIISFRGKTCIEVLAASEEEAEEIADDKFDPLEIDFETENVLVKQIGATHGKNGKNKRIS